MEQKDNKTNRQPDHKAIDRRATEVAAAMSRVLMQPGLTMAESLAAMCGGFSKLIQMIAPMLGEKPEALAEMCKEAIDDYFKHGGDRRITVLTEAYRQKGS